MKIFATFIVSLILLSLLSSTGIAQAVSFGDNHSNSSHLISFNPVINAPKASLTINAISANNEILYEKVAIKSNGVTIKIGFTPLTYFGQKGLSYTITMFDHKDATFSHWQDNGDKNSDRIINLSEDTTFSAIYNKGDRVTLEDLGILQLVSHDLYNTNRTTGIDSEDDKLNLTTLLDYGQQNIANGGEPRNSENIVVHTVAVDLGAKYLGYLNQGKTIDQARHLTELIYLQKIKHAYERTFHESFPKPDPNADELFANDLDGDLALRTLHAFLPGQIMVNGKMTDILDLSLQEKTLNHKDIMQLSKPMDGTFDPAFRNITIFIPPNNLFTIDLLERDSSFAQQFNTDFTFEHFLDELKDGKYNKNDDVMKVIRADFSSSQVGVL